MSANLPDPEPGLVINYSYLWRDEAMQGREEGTKDRPCAIVVAKETGEGGTRVYVVPITHTPPARPEDAIEIPAETKRRLGLDDARSWAVTNELNSFTWPGYDLRSISGPGGTRRFSYGVLPHRLTADIFERLRDAHARGVNRD